MSKTELPLTSMDAGILREIADRCCSETGDKISLKSIANSIDEALDNAEQSEDAAEDDGDPTQPGDVLRRLRDRYAVEKRHADNLAQEEHDYCASGCPCNAAAQTLEEAEIYREAANEIERLREQALPSVRVTDSDEWQRAVDNVARLLCETEEVSVRNDYESLTEEEKQQYRGEAYAMMIAGEP